MDYRRNNSNHTDSQWMKKMFLGIKDDEDIKELLDALDKNKKDIKWKEIKDTTEEVMHLFMKKRIYVTDLEKSSGKSYRYKCVLRELISGLRKAKILKQVVCDLVAYCLDIFEEKCLGLFETAEEVAKNTKDINLKDHRETIFAALAKVNKILKMLEIPWEDVKYGKEGLSTLTKNLLESIGDCRNLTETEGEITAQLSLTILQSDFMDRKREKPYGIYFDMFYQNLGMLLKLTLMSGHLEKQSKIVELFLNLLTHEETEIYTQANYLLSDLGAKSGPVFAPYLGSLLEAFFEKEQSTLISFIQTAYPHNPEPMLEHFQTLFEYIESSDRSISSGIVILLPNIARKQPELFSEENIETLIETMYASDPNFQSMFLMSIEPLADKRPKLFTNQIDKLLERPYNEYAYYYVYKILGTYSSKATEKEAEKILKFFLDILKGNEDGNKRVHAVMQIKVIVASYKSLVMKYQDLLVQIAMEESSPHAKDQINAVVDALEGRSLETLADDIEQHQEDLDSLDSRVTVNENNINTLKDDLGKEHLENKLVQKDAESPRMRSKAVNESELKDESIDYRTTGHAPYWSRDISKLMNPATDADWRLLSSRLGYSNDDIRAWSQQSDPCMAMLNEWYATHKTTEASFGVLTTLQEMDRMDAAIIVENAMKAVVKDLISNNRTRYKNNHKRPDLRSEQMEAMFPKNINITEYTSSGKNCTDGSIDPKQERVVPVSQTFTDSFQGIRNRISTSRSCHEEADNCRLNAHVSLEHSSVGVSNYSRREKNCLRQGRAHQETPRFFSTDDDTFDICDIPAHFNQFSRDVHGRIDTLTGQVSEVHVRCDGLEREISKRDRSQTLEKGGLPSCNQSLDHAVSERDLQLMLQDVQSNIIRYMSEQFLSVNRQLQTMSERFSLADREMQSLSEQFSMVNRELQSFKQKKDNGEEVFI